MRSRSAIVASTSPRRGSRSAAVAIAAAGPGDRRRGAALGEQRRGVGVRERVADAQRGEAERLRHASAGRRGSEARRPTARTSARRTRRTPRRRRRSTRGRRARALDDRPPARPTSPVGLFGLQTQSSSASSSGPTTSAPRSVVAIRYSAYVGGVDRGASSRRRGTSCASRRIRSSAPAPTTTFSAVEPDVRRGRLPELAVRAVRVLVEPGHALRRAAPAARPGAAACSGRT